MRAPVKPPTKASAKAATKAAAKAPAKASAKAPAKAPAKLPPNTATTRTPSPPAVSTPSTGSLRRVSDQFGQRLAERRRAVRRLRIRTVLLGLLAVAVLAGGIYVVMFSSFLALSADQVRVTGATDVVDTETVREIAGAQDGTPLARLRTTDVAEQIESEASGVLSAEVRRQWPDALLVDITPRVPVASVPSDGGFVVLDAQAVELEVTDEARADLPVVDIQLGTQHSVNALEAVVTVLGSLPPPLFDDVVEARAPSADRVELALADGSQVIWGSAEENELKADVLATLRQVPAAVYDVSAPRNPITRETPE